MYNIFRKRGAKMGKVVKRKCTTCGKQMTIDCDNVKDIIYYKRKYYHKNCFIEYAYKRISKNDRYAEMWQDALDNIDTYEKEAEEAIGFNKPTDKLNDWLIRHYDLVTISKRFWSMINDLGNGVYKGKRCKPIDIELLTNAWIWGQGNLDKIDANNKLKGKIITGEGRLYYDLVIVLKHIDDYKRHIARQKTEQESIIKSLKDQLEINYSSLHTTVQNEQKDDMADMSQIIDQIF